MQSSICRLRQSSLICLTAGPWIGFVRGPADFDFSRSWGFVRWCKSMEHVPVAGSIADTISDPTSERFGAEA